MGFKIKDLKKKCAHGDLVKIAKRISDKGEIQIKPFQVARVLDEKSTMHDDIILVETVRVIQERIQKEEAIQKLLNETLS
jgi:ribosome maturation protein Sdo1